MANPFPNGSRFRRECAPDLSRNYLVLIGIVAALYLGAAEFFSIPVCPGRVIFGTHCPTCGVTRALQHLMHGRILLALEANPLSVCLVLTFARAAFAQYFPRTSRFLYFEHSDYLFLGSYFVIGFSCHLARNIEW
jgi:hypothetical protein